MENENGNGQTQYRENNRPVMDVTIWGFSPIVSGDKEITVSDGILMIEFKNPQPRLGLNNSFLYRKDELTKFDISDLCRDEKAPDIINAKEVTVPTLIVAVLVIDFVAQQAGIQIGSCRSFENVLDEEERFAVFELFRLFVEDGTVRKAQKIERKFLYE